MVVPGATAYGEKPMQDMHDELPAVDHETTHFRDFSQEVREIARWLNGEYKPLYSEDYEPDDEDVASQRYALLQRLNGPANALLGDISRHGKKASVSHQERRQLTCQLSRIQDEMRFLRTFLMKHGFHVGLTSRLLGLLIEELRKSGTVLEHDDLRAVRYACKAYFVDDPNYQ